MEPSHVLVPLDGSPLSEAALAHALTTFDCRITVLNVVTPIDAAMSESGVLGTDDERAAAARDRASAAGQSVETAIETGDPAATIVAYARDNDVDQIVMGGHGGDAPNLTERLLGTVATTVVREAPVTVTVVR